MTIDATYEKLKLQLVYKIIIELGNPNANLVESLPRIINNSTIDDVFYVFLGLAIATILFSILVAYFTLRPTRTALNVQKKFIGNIAHELRTPLALLKTTTEVALITEDMSPSVKEIFEDNIKEIDRISNTINNLLTFNALFAVNSMNFKKVNLPDVIEKSKQTLKSLSESRGVKMLVTGNKNIQIWGNETALEQLVNNLVKNAIIYSHKNKDCSVHISVNSDQRGHVNLFVKDRGIGIEQKEVFHILEPFYRVDKSRTNDDTGSSHGLGLTIVSEIAKQHRATVFIKSTVGEGTTIRVRFPEINHWTAHAQSKNSEL